MYTHARICSWIGLDEARPAMAAVAGLASGLEAASARLAPVGGAGAAEKVGDSDEAELQNARGWQPSGLRFFGGHNVYAAQASEAQSGARARGER